MSQINEMIDQLSTAPYSEKKQYWQYLCQVAEHNKQSIPKEDQQALIAYAFESVEQMRQDISNAASYREKDEIFECANFLFGLLWHLAGPPSALPEEQQMKIKALAEQIKKERYLETTLNEIFDQRSVSGADINRLLYWLKDCTDEYQRGKLFLGLGQQELGKLSGDARSALQAYIAAELHRLMAMGTEDAWNTLEVLADVSRYFANETIVYGLLELSAHKRNHINCYILDTLCFLGEDAPQAMIDALASDLCFADWAYQTLAGIKKESLFPAQFSDVEYLAKSCLVHWLTYPTELGKVPDEIEFLGIVKRLFKKPAYVFKFRSDSDTLDDDNKNKWLIGWSDRDGSTFSDFEILPEDEPLAQTLKRVKKRL